jgi:hypothetical protein
MTQNETYMVIFRNTLGKVRQTQCVIIPGYSTVADIPKMITIKYGDACEVLATLKQGLPTEVHQAVIVALTASN